MVVIMQTRQPKIRRKKCVKCGQIKPITEFGKHSTSSDGRQSYCSKCKNALHKRRRHINVKFRIKHHFSTRIKDQLGKNCPEELFKNLEKHLGYSFGELRKALHIDIMAREGITAREALQDGYHIDHRVPLHSFKVTEISTVEGLERFRKCWEISNLKLISASENLAKGGKILTTD